MPHDQNAEALDDMDTKKKLSWASVLKPYEATNIVIKIAQPANQLSGSCFSVWNHVFMKADYIDCNFSKFHLLYACRVM